MIVIEVKKIEGWRILLEECYTSTPQFVDRSAFGWDTFWFLGSLAAARTAVLYQFQSPKDEDLIKELEPIEAALPDRNSPL